VTARLPREEVRRRLLESAAEVFARRGYEAARLDEIAHAAGFTKGAVYSNFAGKHGLLAALIAQSARSQLAVGAAEVQASPDGTLTGIAEAFAGRIVENGTGGRLAVEIAQRAAHDPEVAESYGQVRRALRAELAAELATGCARRGLELTVPAEQLALTLAALRLGLALEHGTDPTEVDEEAVATVLAQTLRGLVRPDLRGVA
jgi:AcrR family transcriptional regulator